MKGRITPTQREIRVAEDDLIVSKTDSTGRITYVNRTFMRISNYPEHALLGQQHNIVRHPDMPRGVFRLMWETLKSEREFFGVIKNMTSDGDFYWVFANVTPDRDQRGAVSGYFSVRRSVSPSAVAAASELYAQMRQIEHRAGPASAPEASLAWLRGTLSERQTTYERMMLGLYTG
ncbi:MAG TPA: PAS domain-containing protein [Rhodocyclaceae bacterium]|nr:PAS domain-containing protein [Rhodocyclaceae bacterium]